MLVESGRATSRRTALVAFAAPPIDPATLWAVRIASAATTYVGIVAFLDRPRGSLAVSTLQVRESTVPNAGLGIFCTTNLPRDTVLGTYPGVVLPLNNNLEKLRNHPQCERYIWRFSDSKFILDPTNRVGEIKDVCRGGTGGLSDVLFQTLLAGLTVPTALCRINEPPLGRDVNVVTDEDLNGRTVTFRLERDVYANEELFIDYGISYDRSLYKRT